jgi:VIT1/CCC1 family predicted Fe2+/Mn2+ transporter
MPDLDSAIRAHARDELGIDLDNLTNPWLAGIASMLAFILGAAVPLIAAVPASDWVVRIATVVTACSAALVVLGMTGNILGGARPWKGAIRVLIGGWLAMGITFAIGQLFSLAGVEEIGH